MSDEVSYELSVDSQYTILRLYSEHTLYVIGLAFIYHLFLRDQVLNPTRGYCFLLLFGADTRI